MNILQAMRDPKVLGHAFGGPSWHAWRCILGGAFGLRLKDHAAAKFKQFTNRAPPSAPVRELLVLAGRRGGKSNIAAAVAVCLATLRHWRLAAGETGTVMVLASDRSQAKVVFNYIQGLLESSPILAQEILSSTADSITLRNGIEICVATSDKASVRGRTVIAAILDELAFWGADAEEVLRALRPGMASQPDAMLIEITTAYSQRGPVFDTFRRYFGTSDPRVLVVRATTRDLNNTIPQSFIDEELERDPQAARAEYLAEFRSDLEALFDADLLDSVTRASPREIPFRVHLTNGTPIVYTAAVDVSGGRQDAAAAAVSHCDGDKVIVDAARRWPAPHDPVKVAAEVAAFLKAYGLTTATSDQYGAELSRSIYTEAGVSLVDSDLNRSEGYLAALRLFTSGRIEIPDDQTLRNELLSLERKTGRSGKDAVDHPPHAHDDLANAMCLCAAVAGRAAAQPITADMIGIIPGQGMADAFIGSGHRPGLSHLEHTLAMNGLITLGD